MKIRILAFTILLPLVLLAGNTAPETHPGEAVPSLEEQVKLLQARLKQSEESAKLWSLEAQSWKQRADACQATLSAEREAIALEERQKAVHDKASQAARQTLAPYQEILGKYDTEDKKLNPYTMEWEKKE